MLLFITRAGYFRSMIWGGPAGGDPERPVEGVGLASWALGKYFSGWRQDI